jgi:hypothetical protein
MMNNQKDTQKTGINIYGKSNVPDSKSLFNMASYEFASKKTEKLVTALYLVSDCMETDDALKSKLRLLGVELLSDIYKLRFISSLEKRAHTSVCLVKIDEVLSFVEISYTIGFISEMNTSILKKEFSSLADSLNESLREDKHFTFSLDEDMFNITSTENTTSERQISSNFIGQDFGKSGVSMNGGKSPLQSFVPIKKVSSQAMNLADRQDRSNKIMSLIKDKKEVSIKDISLAFTDCSEKTIQRELNTLVSKGQIKKTGSKRWSRYGVITN